MNNSFAVFFLLLSVSSIILFSLGFFRQRTSLKHENDTCNISSKAHRPKLVLIVVDAFAYEFVKEYPKDLDFLLNGRGRLFKAHVQAPTVTLPRLKAIVSGTVPTYLDVIFNYATMEFTEDNWINRAKENNYRIRFYGDDTWLKMFPKTFDRSDGTVSFYVTDYTEVDNNVTRHLDFELSHQNEWDIIILHYLGLDHIGHSLGGKSDKISIKLREMNDIIRNINDQLNKSTDYKIVVLGDHGMTESGGHGGSEPRESYVPIVIKGSGMTDGHRQGKEVEQVDLVPTISNILNLCIPVNSLGISFYNELGLGNHELKVMDQNIKQFEKLFENERDLSGLKRVCEGANSCEKCRMEMKGIQYEVLNSLQNLDFNYIYCSFIIMAIGFIMLLGVANLEELRVADILFIVLPPCIWVSSSFIEEEHDILNYLMQSYVLMTVLLRERPSQGFAFNALMVMLIHRIIRIPFEYTRRRWLIEDLQEHKFVYVVYILLFGLALYPVILSWLNSTKMRRGFDLRLVFNAGIALVVVSVKHGLIELPIYPQLLICVTCFTTNIRFGLSLWYYFICGYTDMISACLCQLFGFYINKLKLENSTLMVLLVPTSLFYTGASNTLSAIDINVGYVGLRGYNIMIVALQIALKAYLGPINVLLGRGRPPLKKDDFVMLMALSRCLSILVITLILFWQRSHLFVWSVFAPKYLIEAIHLLVFTLFSVIQIVFNR